MALFSIVVANKSRTKEHFLKRVYSLSLRTSLQCIAQDPKDTTGTSRI